MSPSRKTLATMEAAAIDRLVRSPRGMPIWRYFTSFIAEPVNQEDVGGIGQALDGPDHGQLGGPVDVQGVDLRGRGQSHAHRRGLAEKRGRQLGPAGRRDELGIVDVSDPGGRTADGATRRAG